MLVLPCFGRWAVVTAGADRVGARSGATVSRPLLAVFIAVVPAPAVAAQFGAVASLFSDDRYRGVSVSDGRPVGTLDVSYDASSGLYVNLSGSIVATRDEGLKPLSAVFNAGYAKRLRWGLTPDFGLTHSRYSHYSGLFSGYDLTEAYAGLAGKNVGGRLS